QWRAAPRASLPVSAGRADSPAPPACGRARSRPALLRQREILIVHGGDAECVPPEKRLPATRLLRRVFEKAATVRDAARAPVDQLLHDGRNLVGLAER